MISDNISAIRGQMAEICAHLNRNPNEITLVGVTKFADVQAVQEALEAGLDHIGENKVQEAQKKFPSLKSEGKFTRHMIGHLQTNKVRAALECFDVIQSVDSVKLALEIEKQAGLMNKTVEVLIQVNTAREDQKYGFAPEDLDGALKDISACSHIQVSGLMAIAPLSAEEDVIRQCFRDLRIYAQKAAGQYLNSTNIKMTYLSMGMTNDYTIALEEGSNMIRVGRAIFQ